MNNNLNIISVSDPVVCVSVLGVAVVPVLGWGMKYNGKYEGNVGHPINNGENLFYPSPFIPIAPPPS